MNKARVDDNLEWGEYDDEPGEAPDEYKDRTLTIKFDRIMQPCELYAYIGTHDEAQQAVIVGTLNCSIKSDTNEVTHKVGITINNETTSVWVSEPVPGIAKGSTEKRLMSILAGKSYWFCKQENVVLNSTNPSIVIPVTLVTPGPLLILKKMI